MKKTTILLPEKIKQISVLKFTADKYTLHF